MTTATSGRLLGNTVIRADGEAWRSAKAKMQRRDRFGRFAEMGGGFSFTLKLHGGSMHKVTGKIVGMSGDDDVDVEVKDHDTLKDGVYSIPASKGEAVKAVLSKDAIKDLDESKAKDVVDDVYVEATSLRQAAKFKRQRLQKTKRESRYSRGGSWDDGTIDVAVDVDDYQFMLSSKTRALYDKYLPDEMYDEPEGKIIEHLMEKMGLLSNPDEGSIDEQLTRGVEAIRSTLAKGGDVYAQILDLKTYLGDSTISELGKQRVSEQIANYDEYMKRFETPEGIEKVKSDIAFGFVETLVGLEDFLVDHPDLRGKYFVNMYGESDIDMKREASAYATIRRITDSSDPQKRVKALFKNAYKHESLAPESRAILKRHADGELSPWGVHVYGLPSAAWTTATHEASHVLHFDANLARLGLSLEDLTNYGTYLDDGEDIGDTVIGALYAAGLARSMNTSLGSMNRRIIGDFATRYAMSRALSTEDAQKPEMLLQVTLGDIDDSLSDIDRHAKLLMEAVFAGPEGFNKGLSGYEVDDLINNYEGASRFLEDELGVPADQFVRDLADSISRDLAVDIAYLGTNGIPAEKIAETLGIASNYAKTDILESVAEARTLLHLIDSVKDAEIFENEEKIKEMRSMIKTIINEQNRVLARTPKRTSSRTKNLLDRYASLLRKINKLDWDYATS